MMPEYLHPYLHDMHPHQLRHFSEMCYYQCFPFTFAGSMVMLHCIKAYENVLLGHLI